MYIGKGKNMDTYEKVRLIVDSERELDNYLGNRNMDNEELNSQFQELEKEEKLKEIKSKEDLDVYNKEQADLKIKDEAINNLRKPLMKALSHLRELYPKEADKFSSDIIPNSIEETFFEHSNYYDSYTSNITVDFADWSPGHYENDYLFFGFSKLLEYLLKVRDSSDSCFILASSQMYNAISVYGRKVIPDYFNYGYESSPIKLAGIPIYPIKDPNFYHYLFRNLIVLEKKDDMARSFYDLHNIEIRNLSQI